MQAVESGVGQGEVLAHAFAALGAVAAGADGAEADQALLRQAGLVPDAGVVAAGDLPAFIQAAMTRQ